MGWHQCEYITREEAEALNLRHKEFVTSSGDVTMSFHSGRSWVMPDMILLYVELGWVPPQDFIEDVMNSPLAAGDRRQTRSLSKQPTPVGYLNPRENPIPKPFRINPRLPEVFLDRLEACYDQVCPFGRDSTKAFQRKPAVR